MKQIALKHILFTMLTTMMCFGFSTYVLVSQYDVVKEVNITISEEDSETAQKSITELNNFYLTNEIPIYYFAISLASQSFKHVNDQAVDFILMPNTPPPDLA